MSFGGDGIPGIEPGVQIISDGWTDLGFVPRRFRVGGRFEVEDGPRAKAIPLHTCVLCGGLILHDDEWDYEHPFPKWVHRLAGDVGENRSAFIHLRGNIPTWRQLELAAHRTCNQLFARYIEDPARNAVKTMVEGGQVAGQQIDAVLDWLDKVRTSSAHLATAFMGHGLVLNYEKWHFPNWRIGLFDRAAFFFRIDKYTEALDLWECGFEAFLTTPGALILRIKDLVIVTISNNFLLSSTFGLPTGALIKGEPVMTDGTGINAVGFGSRRTRLEASLIVAQPMRRQHVKGGDHPAAPELTGAGDGHVYHLENGNWRRTRSLNFSQLPILNADIGLELAGLETVEWLILQKEEDHQRRESPAVNLAMRSMPELWVTKLNLIDHIGDLRAGLLPLQNDRL